MKKSILLLVLMTAIFPALVFAYPGIGGGRGLLRVQNALVEDEAGLTISLHGLGRHPIFPGSDNKAWVVDLIAPELSYAPIVTKYAALEVFGSWGGVFQKTELTTDTTDITMTTHDLKAGGKISVPVIPVLKLGFTGSYTFMSGRHDRFWIDKEALPEAGDPASSDPMKYTWAGLVTLQLQDVLPTAPNLMFNYGMINELTRYGLGLELAGRGFAVFVEGLSQQPTFSKNNPLDTDSGQIFVTPGIVFGNVSSFSAKVAYTFAIGREANNEFILGLVVATPFGARPKPQYGTITGRVTDAKTGAELTANVGFPKDDNLIPFTTDATGVFEIKKVKTGITVVEVGAPGYESQSVPFDVKKGAVTTYDFKLRALVAYGVIAGQVLDATTNKPLKARIEFPKSSIAAMNSDQAGGAFRVNKVPTGVYSVTAALDGYFTGSQTVTVEEGKVVSVVFNLTPAGMTATLTGKVSDKKDGKPLAATVSFPKTSVPSVRTDPATGVYNTVIPAGSYAVAVTSEGYIDQTAAIVMVKDKPLVKDFELVKIGMTITLRGVYFDFDKATIKPESRPALDDAAKILKDNPSINVEIQGHTDSKGSDSYNLNLSDQRAWSVVSYLVQNFGIDKARLTAKGYGEARPIATNDTDDGRALNRRVEFVILGQLK